MTMKHSVQMMYTFSFHQNKTRPSDPQEGSWCDKKYDRCIKQILLIPNNLCFGSILEVILLHGCLDPSEGSWGHG